MILLDTHAIYWFLTGNTELPEPIKEKVIDDAERHISIASFWEMTIKSSIGKLKLPESISDMIETCRGHGFKILDIDGQTLECLRTLEFIHRDPFDRLIVSQAMSRNLTLITKDENIQKYPVKTYWK